MPVAALDLNANRIWAVRGTPGQSPSIVPLDGDAPELPLFISFENRTAEVGRAGLALCRCSPHLICSGFLPKLGTQEAWSYRRHRLTAAEAMTAIFAKAQKPLSNVRSGVLAVPSYLSRPQIVQLKDLANKAKIPIAGVVSRASAAALHSHSDQPWHNLGIVVDVDDHALSCTILRADDAELLALARQSWPELGLLHWKERIITEVANICVRTSRRDPREAPEAEQSLFDQMDRVLQACSQNQAVPLRVQGSQWYQTLTLHPGDAATACHTLARRAGAAIRSALTWAEQQMTSATIYFTAAAARLPALAAAVYQSSENKVPVVALPAAATAKGAFALAARIDRGDLAPGIYDPATPLPRGGRGQPAAVLKFPGQTAKVAGKPG